MLQFIVQFKDIKSGENKIVISGVQLDFFPSDDW